MKNAQMRMVGIALIFSIGSLFFNGWPAIVVAAISMALIGLWIFFEYSDRFQNILTDKLGIEIGVLITFGFLIGISLLSFICLLVAANPLLDVFLKNTVWEHDNGSWIATNVILPLYILFYLIGKIRKFFIST